MRAASSNSFSLFPRALCLIAVTGLAGCSSDVTRVTMPWSAPQQQHMATAGWAGSQEATGSIQQSAVQSQSLPPVAGAQASALAPAYAPTPEAANSVIVNKGDSVNGLAKRYHISAASLMAANHLKSANAIRIGQRLAIPGAAIAAVSQPQPTASVEYTVNQGDTLSSIAHRYNVAPGEIARVNNFSPTDKLYVGRKITIPGAAAQAKMVPDSMTTGSIAAPKVAAKTTMKPVAVKHTPVAAKPAAELPAPEAKKEEPATTQTALVAPTPMNSTEFRWPVQGRVVANYGPQQGGGHNDGIDIAVPAGTPVKAAENGVVAYAGAELKGYGNLILIRHEGDYVTAYAHNSSIAIKRGDMVKRGQVIGYAGQTGNVSQPQLHFEIRKGSTPVDPMTHLVGG